MNKNNYLITDAELSRMLKECHDDEDLTVAVLSNIRNYDKSAVLRVIHSSCVEDFQQYDSDVCEQFILSYQRIKLERATEKQIKFATYLSHRMGVKLPKENTKYAYSVFIAKWKKAVEEEDRGMNMPDAWTMQYL